MIPGSQPDAKQRRLRSAGYRDVDPYRTGETCPPNNSEGETSMVMSPPNILEFSYFAAGFILSSKGNNCFLLYFNANFMCSFTKKLHLLGDFVPHIPYWGSAPGPHWGTSVPQTPSVLLCPPNNPVRSTPLTGYLS